MVTYGLPVVYMLNIKSDARIFIKDILSQLIINNFSLLKGNA